MSKWIYISSFSFLEKTSNLHWKQVITVNRKLKTELSYLTFHDKYTTDSSFALLFCFIVNLISNWNELCIQKLIAFPYNNINLMPNSRSFSLRKHVRIFFAQRITLSPFFEEKEYHRNNHFKKRKKIHITIPVSNKCRNWTQRSIIAPHREGRGAGIDLTRDAREGKKNIIKLW